MARRRTSETAGPAAEAFADALEASAASCTATPEGPPAPERPSKPRRDVRGRYVKRGGRLKKVGRPRSGRRGPSYLANRRQEALVRMCIVLEHKVGRLEAELDHQEWRDPVRSRVARMKGIQALQTSGQDARLAALTDVLVDMSEERIPRDIPKRHEEIARRLAVKLEKPCSWRTLYNKPYRSAWRTIDDALASHAANDAATFADRSRWTKPMLVWRILELGRRRDELFEMLRARLLNETADEEGWDPIPRRKGSAEEPPDRHRR